MTDCRIGLLGCAGRMGRMLAAVAEDMPGARIAGGIDASPDIVGRDIGELAGIGASGLRVTRDLAALGAASDVLIDFTAPAASLSHAAFAAASGKPIVIGTTGIDADGMAAIARAAERIPVLWSANMSLGVAVLTSLVEETARRLGPAWDIEILEMHHRAKADAPSGTALELGRAAARGRGESLEALSVRGRDGLTGARREGSIGFAALRGGDVPGEHSVIFAGAGERIELAHKAGSRRIFAQGALAAALWLWRQKPGLYGISQVLGL